MRRRKDQKARARGMRENIRRLDSSVEIGR